MVVCMIQKHKTKLNFYFDLQNFNYSLELKVSHYHLTLLLQPYYL
jgi:5-hydroxyisourate hydrolase-like protein (transthyretin family)